MTIIDFIRSVFCGDMQSRINQLKSLIKAYKIFKVKQHDEIMRLHKLVEKKDVSIKALELQLLDSTGKEKRTDPPEWLNLSKKAYRPSIQYVDPKGEIKIVRLDPREMYESTPALRKLVKSRKWGSLKGDDKLFEIWKYVVHGYNYQFDYKEGWNFPAMTYRRKRGDCEDTTMLFITLCRIAGVPSNKIFNACGFYGSIGHSFPIAQQTDGKWYIYETTISRIRKKPFTLKGSNYTIEKWGGLANWAWKGNLNEGKQI